MKLIKNMCKVFTEGSIKKMEVSLYYIRKEKKGYSLAEVLIGVAILAVVFIPLLGTFITGYKGTIMTQNHLYAYGIAKDIINLFQHLKYSELMPSPLIPLKQYFKNLSSKINISVNPAPDPPQKIENWLPVFTETQLKKFNAYIEVKETASFYDPVARIAYQYKVVYVKVKWKSKNGQEHKVHQLLVVTPK